MPPEETIKRATKNSVFTSAPMPGPKVETTAMALVPTAAMTVVESSQRVTGVPVVTPRTWATAATANAASASAATRMAALPCGWRSRTANRETSRAER